MISAPKRPARRTIALPWILLAIGLCLMAAIGVALLVFTVPQRPEVVVPGPVVTIRIDWEAASPEEVELRLAIPAEERLDRIAGTVAIRTEARVGECAVEMEFASGTRESAALDSVRRALDDLNLPEEADQPEVELTTAPGDRTVLLVLSGDVSARDLLRGVDVVRERLSRDPGVRRVETIGAPREILLVQADEHALARFGISPDALVNSVREGVRTEAATGSSDRGAGTVLSQLVIPTRDGIPVYLRDVARVTDSQDTPTSEALDEAGPVMLIRVVCSEGADGPFLRGDVTGLERLLPPGVRLQVRRLDEPDDHLLLLHWRAPAGEAAPALREIARSLSSEEGVSEMIAWTSPNEGSRALLRTDVPASDLTPTMVGVLKKFVGVDLLSHPDPARKPLTFDVDLGDGQDPAGTGEDLRNVLRSLQGVEFVMPGPPPPTPELRLVVDRKRAAVMGIPSKGITEQVALSTTGQEIGTISGLPVVVRIGEPPSRADDVAGLRIWSPSGEWVPLTSLATFELVARPTVIRRVFGRRAVSISLVPSEGTDREKVLANAREAVHRRMQKND